MSDVYPTSPSTNPYEYRPSTPSDQKENWKSDHFTQHKPIDTYDQITTTDNDDEDDNISSSTRTRSQQLSKSSGDKILTPRQFRSTQRAPLSKAFPDAENSRNRSKGSKQPHQYLSEWDEHLLTPTKYRLERIRHEILQNIDNTDRDQQEQPTTTDNTKPLYNEYRIKSGSVEVSQKPATNENSLYGYVPKRTQMEWTVKAIIDGAEVQKRALDEINRLTDGRMSGHSSIIIKDSDDPSKPPVLQILASTVASVDPRTPSPEKKPSVIDENFPPDSISRSPLVSPPRITPPHNDDIREDFPPPPPDVHRYCFGPESNYPPTGDTNLFDDDDEEDSGCVSLFNAPMPKFEQVPNRPTPSVYTEQRITSNSITSELQHVSDAGTSTNNSLSLKKPQPDANTYDPVRLSKQNSRHESSVPDDNSYYVTPTTNLDDNGSYPRKSQFPVTNPNIYEEEIAGQSSKRNGYEEHSSDDRSTTNQYPVQSNGPSNYETNILSADPVRPSYANIVSTREPIAQLQNYESEIDEQDTDHEDSEDDDIQRQPRPVNNQPGIQSLAANTPIVKPQYTPPDSPVEYDQPLNDTFRRQQPSYNGRQITPETSRKKAKKPGFFARLFSSKKKDKATSTRDKQRKKTRKQ